MNIKKFINEKDISDDEWYVETDRGYKKIKSINETIPFFVYIIKTNNHTLKCADEHKICCFKDNKKIDCYIKDIKINDKIYTENGIENVVSVEKTDISENMFDIEIDDEYHHYYTNGILSHNTTTTVCFLLWYALFNDNKTVAILANKLEMAKEIMSRIQIAYSSLPKWLQSGIVSFNKTSMELENGCKIVASATSPSAIRGNSVSCLFIDECLHGNTKVKLKNKKTNEIIELSLKELYDKHI